MENADDLYVAFKNWQVDLVGRQFGVFKIKNTSIDISLPRTEVSTGPHHRDFKAQSDPFLSKKEACARRDFTINAILWDIVESKLIDPYSGIDDLMQKDFEFVVRSILAMIHYEFYVECNSCSSFN